MVKQILCWVRYRHEYEQFEKIRYENGYPIMRFGKECRLCGKRRWMR